MDASHRVKHVRHDQGDSHRCLSVGKPDQDGQDPDFSLQGLLEPIWSNHSLRRLADSTARRHMHVTTDGRMPVTAEEIDIFFGWHETEMSQDMQIIPANAFFTCFSHTHLVLLSRIAPDKCLVLSF